MIPVKSKEPWQMTAQEFERYGASLQRQQRAGLRPTQYGLMTHTQKAAQASDELARIGYGRGHRWHIEKALREGRRVPPEVLADYKEELCNTEAL